MTGGAGFIGANFVLDWLALSGEPVINLDKLTYAGNPQNLAGAGEGRPPRLRPRRHRRPRPGRQAAGRAPARARSSTSPPSRHVDRSIDGPADFIQTNVVGTFHLLEAVRGLLDTLLDEPEKAAFRFLHVSTDEVYGSLGPDDAPFTETTPLRAQLPLLRQQGRRPTIWCAPTTTPTACRC